MQERVKDFAGIAGPRGAYLPLGWFLGMAVVSVLAFQDAVVAMVRTWATTTTFTHGFLILPISLILVWIKRESLRGAVPRQEPWMLLPLLGLSIAWTVGRAADVMLVQQIAFVGVLIGLFVFAFGREIARTLAFPLGFLFFMVPAGDVLVPALQDFTAIFAVTILRIIGIPIFHDHILIQTPTGMFEVAEACAGIRFLIANVVVAALFAYLGYSRWWKRALFLAFGVVLPIIANGFRAFGIIAIAYWTNNEYAVGVDHIVYGWGFFTFVMLLLLFIGSRFTDHPLGWFPAGAPAASVERPWRAGLAAVAVAAALFGPAYALAVMRPPAFEAATLGAPGAVSETWQRLDEASAAQAPDWQPFFPGADHIHRQTYGTTLGTVDFVVAYYAYQRQGAEVVYHGNRLEGDDWRRIETRTLARPGGGLPPARLDRLGLGSRQRLVLSWYWVDGRLTADPVAAKLWQSLSTLTGRNRQAAVVAVATDLGAQPQEALARLAAFLDTMVPLSPYLEAFDDGGH